MRARLVLVALVAAGCGGGPPADLFVVQRDGSVPGAKLSLRLTDDGGAYCNDRGRRELTSEQLLDAREIRRGLNGEKEDRGPADERLRLAPGRGAIFSYRVRTEDGVVEFSDNSRAAPEVFPRIVKLTRDVAREICALSR